MYEDQTSVCTTCNVHGPTNETGESYPVQPATASIVVQGHHARSHWVPGDIPNEEVLI